MRRVRAGKLTKPERVYLDDLAKAVVMLRHGAGLLERVRGGFGWWGSCLRCMVVGWLQWSHIHSRKVRPRSIWDPDNALALCRRCHETWHSDPTTALEFLLRVLGQARIVRLKVRVALAPVVDKDTTRMWLEREVQRMSPEAWKMLFDGRERSGVA